MKPVFEHRWDLTYRQAVALQNELAPKLVLRFDGRPIRTVAGVDVAYSKKSARLFAAVEVFRLAGIVPVTEATATRPAAMPYIPGLLSFREMPVVLDAFRSLEVAPDVVICDGQGLAHPRRFGLACHAGLLLDVPSIGCAKSRLVGEHDPVGGQPGDSSPLVLDGKMVGCVLRTKARCNALYISPGHLMDIETARRLVLECCRGYKLPEPTRRAHMTVSRLRSQAAAQDGSRWR